MADLSPPRGATRASGVKPSPRPLALTLPPERPARNRPQPGQTSTRIRARARPELGDMVHPADTGPARSWCRRIERSAGSRAVMSVGAGPRACPDDSTTPHAAPSQMGNHRGLPLRHGDEMTNGADVSLSSTAFRPHPGAPSWEEAVSPAPDFVYGREVSALAANAEVERVAVETLD